MSSLEITDRNNYFFDRLEKLPSGDRARLQHCLGKSLEDASDVLKLFRSLLPQDTPTDQEEIFFFVATLYPLAAGGNSTNLGESLRKAQNKKKIKGMVRRVEALLDAEGEQLRFHLRHMIHYLNTNRVTVNWPQLLDDLLQWENPERYIQTQWIRSYLRR